MEPRAILAIVPPSCDESVLEAARAVGADVRVERSASEGAAALETGPFTATLVSLSAGWMDLATAGRLAADARAGRVLVSATAPSLALSVAARNAGIAAVLAEPFGAKRLATELERPHGSGAGIALPDPVQEEGPLLLGASEPMVRVFELIARIAEASATVLVTGESGTGKELVARAVHWASERRDGPFVAVNCAAIPEDLLESELFGHERGAFTGAVARKIGRFERACGGTLFLDEIGDMSLVLQAKILRALEEREIERLGGGESIPVDVRVVAATHRDLRDRMAHGEFREDLFFRLAVVEVPLPPLRARGDDLEHLALHFAADFAERYGRRIEALAARAMERLRSYSWPGNVRELRNVMDRAVVLSRGPVISEQDLQLGISAPHGSARGPEAESGFPPTMPLDEVEAHHIRRVLEHTDGHMQDAAKLLGIHRNTLSRKVREYAIEMDR